MVTPAGLWISIAVAYCALAADASLGQIPSGETSFGRTFEVASIHTRSDGTGEIWTIRPFRFDFSGPAILIENFTLSDLIGYAYDIKDYELFTASRTGLISIVTISRREPLTTESSHANSPGR